MKKIVLFGRSGSGKTTLTQALKGEEIHYHKTQYINHLDMIIDTPGEYAQNKQLASALALYSYEADLVGLLIAANEPYSIFPPNICCMCNRETVGIITKVDASNADVKQAERWLKNAGCKKIFYVDSKNRQGIEDLLEYLEIEEI